MGDSYVVTGAMMTCTFGMAPSSLVVNPSRTKFLSNMQRGNIMDFAPMVNIMPFGMCNTPSNPTVAAATAAAMGVLTPMPCIPAITAPWMPGNMQCLIQGQPALTRMSQCICMWGGVIKFTTDGQFPGIPPVIIPPIDVEVTLPAMLSQAERAQLEPWEEQQYERDMEQAKHAGANDTAIADSLDRMAAKYEAEGNSAKAQKAKEASLAYRESAAKKQVAAMEEVNDKYRPGSDKKPVEPEKPAMTKEELQEVQANANKEQAKQQKEIDQIDKKLEQNHEIFQQRDEELKEANEKMIEASKPWKEAKEEHAAATSRREKAEENVAFWNQVEQWDKQENAKPEAKQFNLEQKKKAEDELKAAQRAEEKAKAKEEKAKKKLTAAEKEQYAAADRWHESLDEYSSLSKQKKEAEEKKKDAANTAYNAQKAINAQDTLQKHEEAKKQYESAKKATQEKRLEMDAYAQQQNKAQKEADAWENLGVNAYIHSSGEQGDKFFANADEHKAQANDAGQKKEQARQQWEQSKQQLKEAHDEALSDDALFDAYTAKIDLQLSMDALNNKAK